MKNKLSFLQSKKALLILSLLMVSIIGVPLTVYLVQTNQQTSNFAHTPLPTAVADCELGNVYINFSYVLTNLPTNITATVTVTDSQGYVSDSFGYKNGDPAYNKKVDTHLTSVQPGILTFLTVATDGFQKTNQVSYSAAGPCVEAEQTPTPTITPSVTVTTSPTLTPTKTPSVTVTPTVTLTMTLTPTISPSVTTTSTPTPTPSLTSTPTPTENITNGPTSTPTPTQVGKAQPTLIPTGPSTNFVQIGLMGVLIALIGGILLFGL